MQDELRVALIQSNLVWENPAQNRIDFSNKIANISEAVDLIVLPEMFATGFTMNAQSVAETMQAESIKWMKDIAHKANAAICGSLIIEEQGNYYNRLIFVKSEGDLEFYDKRHTFTLAGEDKVYTAGKDKLLVNYKGWKICPLVCYDLRFPVWARNVEAYDMLLYVANWPKPRITAWDALLRARAIENMSYCIGVNRVGVDINNYEYSGHSAAYDVLGNRIDTIPVDKEYTEVITLNKRHIEAYRNKLNFLNDRDDFILK